MEKSKLEAEALAKEAGSIMERHEVAEAKLTLQVERLYIVIIALYGLTLQVERLEVKLSACEGELREALSSAKDLQHLCEKDRTRAEVAEAKAAEWEERSEAASSVAVSARHARDVAQESISEAHRRGEESMREAETEFRLEMQTSLSLLQREIDVLEANKTRLEADLAGCAAAAAVAAKEQLEDELKRGFEAHVSSLQQKVKTLGAKLADTMTTADAALADSHSQAEENGSLKRAMSQKQTEIDAVKAQVIGLRAKLNKKEADLKEARGLATPSHKAMQAAYNQATEGECPPSPVLPCIDAAVQEEASPRQKRPLQASNISNAVPQEAGKGGPKAGVGGASGGSLGVDGIDACISPLVEEIYAAADPNGTGILSFRDFARWASWDGQVLEWLDGATRAMGASLDAKDEGARARLGKVELGGLLKAYRAEGRSLDSPFGAGDSPPSSGTSFNREKRMPIVSLGPCILCSRQALPLWIRSSPRSSGLLSVRGLASSAGELRWRS